MYNDDDTQPTRPITPDLLEDEPLVQVIGREPQGKQLISPATVFTVRNLHNYRIAFSMTGQDPCAGTEATGWNVDFESLNVQMNQMGQYIAAYHQEHDETGREAWRATVRQLGVHLYNGLLAVDAQLAACLVSARHQAGQPERLALVFEGSHSYLGVPYEILHDDREALAVCHPISRRVAGVIPQHRESFETLANRLRASGEPLHVLLIAADMRQPAADQEVAAVAETIYMQARRARLNVDIQVMSTRQSSLHAIREKLSGCTYHLVHFAGQIHSARSESESSGLLFWAGHGAMLSTRALSRLFKTSQTRLFYLSAYAEACADCTPPRSGLEIMSALALTGLPYVLGLRWYVPDLSRQRLACHFYRSLFTDPYVPERALLNARQAVYERDRQDESWIAPLLVAQPVTL